MDTETLVVIIDKVVAEQAAKKFNNVINVGIVNSLDKITNDYFNCFCS